MSACENCSTPSGLPIPVANEIQDTIQYKDWSPDWWRVAHTMTSARAWGRSNRLLTSDICTPDWKYIWHSRKIYGIAAFMLNGLYRNMPVFLDDNFMIQEHKFSFGFVPYSSSVVSHKKLSTGKLAFDCPTVMSAERNVTKGQTRAQPRPVIQTHAAMPWPSFSCVDRNALILYL